MNPISLLCEIIEQAGKVAAQAYRDDARYGVLLDAGLIQRDGVVQSVVCEDCAAPHDAEIFFEGGSYGHYCFELGFVPIERAELVAMRPDFNKLVDQLHVAFRHFADRVSTLNNLRHGVLLELIRKPYSLTHIRLSLVPKLPSKASTNLGAPQSSIWMFAPKTDVPSCYP